MVANRNQFDGIGLDEDGGHLVNRGTTKNNREDGLRILCPSNVLRLTSTGNARNLVVKGFATDCALLKTPPPEED